MRPTRAFWEVAGIALTAAVLAPLFGSPSLLLVTVLLASWLLAHQLRFARDVQQLSGSIEIEQSVSRRHLYPGEQVEWTLRGRHSSSAGMSIMAAVDAPATVRLLGEQPRVDLDRLNEAYATGTIELPVAGQITLSRPTITSSDRLGLFESNFRTGAPIDLVVEPETPGEMHVGAGGQGFATAYGEHEGGPFGSGITPDQLRTYQPGDPADRIDWKATARLGEPYVREFESETDLETAIVIDHRGRMATGPPGSPKLSFAREIALAYLARARELGDPLGLYAVGDGGLSIRERPAGGAGTYESTRQKLLDLSPTAGTGESTQPYSVSPARARQLAHRLSGDDPFEERLGPFLADAVQYVRRMEDRPFFQSVKMMRDDMRGHRRTVLITDDTERIELTEAVKLAGGEGAHVIVYLLPNALFEPGGLTDLDATYESYLDFEQFRRDLSRFEHVSAFEVAPDDRLGAVLANARARRVDA